MTEIETDIRKAVIERVDRAPMAPSLESIDVLDRASLPVAHRQPRRGLLVGAGMVALLALVAGVLVTVRLSQDDSQVSVGTTLAPQGKPATPLAGRSLPARYGLPNGVAGYHFFTMELDRPVGLAADDVTYLPTGPLGPMYAQNFRIDYDPSAFGLPDVDGIAVLTVLPEERESVTAAATGAGPTRTATVEGHDVTVTDQWSSTDNRAVSWVQDGAAIIVTGSPSVTEEQLLAAAAEVKPIPSIPRLPPVAADAKGSGVLPASYSLTPRRTDDPKYLSIDGTPWDELTSWDDALAPAMGKLLASGRDGSDHYTLRIISDPMTGEFPLGAPAGVKSEEPIPFGPVWISVFVGRSSPLLPNRYDVTGSTPVEMATVEVTLDDGTTLVTPTYDAGLGWPGRSYTLFVADGRKVVHVNGRSSDGTLLYTRDLDRGDGSHPDGTGGLSLDDFSVCGQEEPQPQFPTLDC